MCFKYSYNEYVIRIIPAAVFRGGSLVACGKLQYCCCTYTHTHKTYTVLLLCQRPRQSSTGCMSRLGDDAVQGNFVFRGVLTSLVPDHEGRVDIAGAWSWRTNQPTLYSAVILTGTPRACWHWQNTQWDDYGAKTLAENPVVIATSTEVVLSNRSKHIDNSGVVIYLRQLGQSTEIPQLAVWQWCSTGSKQHASTIFPRMGYQLFHQPIDIFSYTETT